MPIPPQAAIRLAVLKRTLLARVAGSARIDAGEVSRWIRGGCPKPAPSFVKRLILAQYFAQFGLTAAVETGTFLGDTTEFLSAYGEVHSIEIQPDLFDAARRRFEGRPNVHIHHGDSGQLLPGVLAAVDQPVLLWLDGHYSGGFTGSAAQHTPVVAELDAAGKSPHAHGHVILIDDARLFEGKDGYPTLHELRSLARSHGYDRIYVSDDIIRIHCRETRGSQ